MTELQSIAARYERYAPRRTTVLLATLLVLVELLVVTLYLELAPVVAFDYQYYVYPFVWINVGLLAVLTTRPPPVSAEKRQAGIAIAVGYFLVLAWAGGLIAAGYALRGNASLGVQASLATIPPGWGPAVMVDTPIAKLLFMPYQVVGYVALAYLVYVTVLDAAVSALGGVIGLLSCVSCTWPVLASLVSGVVGSTASIVVTVNSHAYLLSTVVFVVTVGLLYWRPTLVGRGARTK